MNDRSPSKLFAYLRHLIVFSTSGTIRILSRVPCYDSWFNTLYLILWMYSTNCGFHVLEILLDT